MEGIIVNLAPTGMVPTKAMNSRVPVSTAEIAADAERCVALGVNVLHLHARDATGEPTYKKETYARLIGAVRERCPNVVICVSLSGRQFTAYEERSDVLKLTDDLKPDMASLTLSSMNFGNCASVNQPEMIQRLAAQMADAGIRPELEVFDTGMLNYGKYLLDKEAISAPLYFNIILGNIATAQATPAHLGLMMSQLPAGSIWTGGGLGEHQLPMNAMGLLYGNGVRVGLEDNLWLDSDREQPASNVDLVERVVELACLMNRPVATAEQVRAALGLSARG